MGKRPPPPPLDVERGNYMAPRPGPPPIGPPPHRPWFSWLIPIFFFVNVGMFVYVMYLNDCPANTGAKNCMLSPYLGRYSFQPFKQNPLLGPTPNTLLKLGALDRKLAVNGEWWRLFSCMWLHAGLIHLLANMLGLLVMGIRLERDFGFLRVGILYVLAGFGGSLVSSLKNTSTISVGASGALFGLLGATLSELITNWTIYANKCAAFLNLIIVIIINLAIGFLPHVDSSAHIGGFISGFFLGFVILVRSQFGYVSPKYIPKGYHVRPKAKFNCMQYILFFISVIIIVIGYAFGLGKLFNIPMFRTILPQIASG